MTYANTEITTSTELLDLLFAFANVNDLWFNKMEAIDLGALSYAVATTENFTIALIHDHNDKSYQFNLSSENHTDFFFVQPTVGCLSQDYKDALRMGL